LYITKVKIKNFKGLAKTEISFKKTFNILVGNNEVGKSSVLEAINLALSGHLNGRYIHYELQPFLFNKSAVDTYLTSLSSGKPIEPPPIEIEVYFEDEKELARLKGTQNSLKEDVPGVRMSIEFDENFSGEYESYISKPAEVSTIPYEYYKISWLSFANEVITSRSIPVKPCLIDASSTRNYGANRYVVDIMKESLSKEERAQLSISFRKMKDVFISDPIVSGVNSKLATGETTISHKNVSISLDSSSRSIWENGVETQVNEIPVSLSGKGEQSTIKIQLAMASNSKNHVFLIEEPENHLSFTNLNRLLGGLNSTGAAKQLIITTHSNFVLNKLGIENVTFMGEKGSISSITSLGEGTQKYFMKLPGHDTLRLINSSKAILVEGPSDELIIQKAYYNHHGKMPLEDGVDVISVNALAFKRFLEISKQLKIKTIVVTDNDGNFERVCKKYQDFEALENIHIKCDSNNELKTLEPQILYVNELETLNKAFGTKYSSNEEILDFMINNKTECALRIFNYEGEIKFPNYINEAVVV
jgi:AAA15 family ATPase/GTPase/5S rRNA maturation endonuclease (ribonuclease M5)